MRECAKKSGTKCLDRKGDFENRYPVKKTNFFQLHPFAKIVRYNAISTCVHARVPGIPEVGFARSVRPILNIHMFYKILHEILDRAKCFSFNVGIKNISSVYK